MKTVSQSLKDVVESHHCATSIVDDDGYVAIYDEEGDWLVTIPHDTSPELMRIIFKHGARMYQMGCNIGQEEAKSKIRSALGIERSVSSLRSGTEMIEFFKPA